MPARLSVEALESRECPAFVRSFAAGHLRIVFDNELATGQAVTISSINGRVTFNERPTKLLASAVRKITVVGSDLDNWIDLHFVSTGTGFRGLNGKVVVRTGGGNDVLMGTQFGDRLDGGDGFDQLWGNNGNDTLLSGPGDDSIYPGYGADTVYLGPGSDWHDVLEPIDVTVPA